MLTLLNFGTIHAQQPPAPTQKRFSPLIQSRSTLDNAQQPESDCTNGIDDNNNGLTDLKDFHCYFNDNTHMENCTPTKIVWMSTNQGIHWVDLETNELRLVMPLAPYRYEDLTWASNGKLYGAEFFGQIVEIDPHSSQETPIGSPEGHYYTNGMTGDAAGKLYLSSYTTLQDCNILRYDLGTRKTEHVISLTEYGLNSAGDLCFINGYLYVSCLGNTVAKIDINRKTLEKLTIINSPLLDGPFGMTYLGDGYLYITNNADEIYRVDLTTMQATLYAKLNQNNFIVLGFTSYTDLCNGPGCKARVNITTDKLPPYCANEGVMITANGQGVKGESGYIWTLPNGSTSVGKTFNARASGTYYVRYHTMPDTCGIVDSIQLNITPHPFVDLGSDTFVCTNIPLKLSAKVRNATAFHWEDGGTDANRMLTMPGEYWIEATNHCGVVTDTILVTQKDKIPVSIGNDTLICQNTTITLENNSPIYAHTVYKWSNGMEGNRITVEGAGTYWLESSNACGTVRDEIIIAAKDSCLCDPFHPKIDAGKDRWLCAYDTLIIGNAHHDDGFKYLWNNGSHDKLVVVKNPGTYTVDVSTYCGTITDTVIVHQKIDDCECFLYTPNAFSPNYDSRNDAFELRSNCVVKGTIKIFNRWGGIVYSSEDLSKGWDGRVGNDLQPSGLYIYHVHYEYVNRPGKFLKKGTITLVR